MKKIYGEKLQVIISLLEKADRPTADYLVEHKTPIYTGGIGASKSAIWTLWGSIILNKDQYPNEETSLDAWWISVICHEVCHLRQGPLTAFSVYGELEAWQVGFGIYQSLTKSQPSPLISRLLQLPLGYDLSILREARALMRQHAGPKYRIDLYPLLPLHLWAKHIF